MNLNFKSTQQMLAQTRQIGKFQEGGPMPEDPAMAGGEAPMPEDQGAPQEGGEDQLAQVAQQLVDMLSQQIGDPQAIAQILQMALEMVSQGGGAPVPNEQPVYAKGGRLLYRIKK